jgi:hypothetical protein
MLAVLLGSVPAAFATDRGGPTRLTRGQSLVGPILPGRGSRKTDCFGEWAFAGATEGKAVVTCQDGDPACDANAAPGCVVLGQICMNDAANPRADGKCTPAAVTSFRITSKARDQVDQDNGTAIAVELVFGFEDRIPGLDARIASGNEITFDPGISQTICTEPFEIMVPLRQGRRGPRKGIRKLNSVTTGGGKRDRDAAKLVCLP